MVDAVIPAKPGCYYSEIRDHIKTFDLLMFRGGDFVSDTIATVESATVGVNTFTHVGMAFRGTDFPIHNKYWSMEKIYIFESTASGKLVDGVPSVLDNKGHLGVQLRNLDLVVAAYDANPKTRMAWMPIADAQRIYADINTVPKLITKFSGKTYDASCIDLSAAAFPFLRCIRDSRVFRSSRDWFYRTFCCGARPSRWLFCSELCAEVYKELGLFPPNLDPADVMPVDFLPKRHPDSPEESTPPQGAETVDRDKQVPWIFKKLIRFHS